MTVTACEVLTIRSIVLLGQDSSAIKPVVMLSIRCKDAYDEAFISTHLYPLTQGFEC